MAAVVGYSEELAHRILAGADACLMPSRFEPCGLVQLYALRYGAVPIVRRTGGLADTVLDPQEAGRRATGFSFREEGGLLHGVARALEARASAERWRALVTEGMRQDHSWARSASDYSALYDLARGDVPRAERVERVTRVERAPAHPRRAPARAVRREVLRATCS